MAKTPYLPLYYNDLRGATQDWTDEEFGAYVRLLIYQWDKGLIPGDMSRILKIADSAEKNWPVLCQKFTPGENGFLKNSVMEKIRENFNAFSQKQREKVLKRWGKNTKPVPEGYQTDTKPLPKRYPRVESESEYDNDNEIKEKGYGEKEKIVMPFTSESFRVLWLSWKNYRFQEFKKKYKSSQSEQQALSHLHKLSGGSEETAKEIIEQSEANQWQGLFKLKNQENGSTRTTTTNKGKATGGLELLEDIRTNSRNNAR